MYKKLFVGLLGFFAMIVVVTQLTSIQVGGAGQSALSLFGRSTSVAPVNNSGTSSGYGYNTNETSTGSNSTDMRDSAGQVTYTKTPTSIAGTTTEVPGKASVNKTGQTGTTYDVVYTYQLSRTLSIFSPASAKNDVMILQYFLIQEGYLSSTAKVDGKFGNMTRAAVIKYQKAHGISQTGNVGTITKASINTILSQKGLVNLSRIGTVNGTINTDPQGRALVN